MAESKYAALPGIDLLSPNVYETKDLPEADQSALPPEELQSNSVEALTISTAEAFKKFQGKGVHLGEADFSDSVAKFRKSGYYVPRTEYDILTGVREPETASQRVQRLQMELAEVEADVAHAKKLISSTFEGTESKFGLEISALQARLGQLQTAAVCGPEISAQLADPQNVMLQKLSGHLDRFQHKSKSNKKSSEPGALNKDKVTYELYYQPENVGFKHTQKAAELEQRLQRLEATLGSKPEKLSALTSDSADKPLVSALEQLESKLNLLDSSNLDIVEGRLAALNHKLGETQKKTHLESDDNQRKINELYSTVQKWSAYSDTLPQVVDRLMALKELHQQALQFSQALTQLETAQQQLGSSVQHHSDTLAQVQKGFAANMDVIKKSIDSLNNRFESLSKK